MVKGVEKVYCNSAFNECILKSLFVDLSINCRNGVVIIGAKANRFIANWVLLAYGYEDSVCAPFTMCNSQNVCLYEKIFF